MCASETYASAHASVVERFHIVLLFNSDRVIDLALGIYVNIYRRTHIYSQLLRRKRARKSSRATERKSIV